MNSIARQKAGRALEKAERKGFEQDYVRSVEGVSVLTKVVGEDFNREGERAKTRSGYFRYSC